MNRQRLDSPLVYVGAHNVYYVKLPVKVLYFTIHIHTQINLDLLARRVFRGGTRLELTAKEFSLLSLLARHQGEILSKMMIAEQVWDMNFDSDANVVEVAIKRLRAKVDAPFDVKLLHTVRGMGYVLEVRPE